MKIPGALLLSLALLPVAASQQADAPGAPRYEEHMEVQVVDLQVSVMDERGQFLNQLEPEDFVVTEDGVPQQVLDLELVRQPFSIGVLVDTSSSMQSMFQLIERGTRDFLSSLKPEDEYFLMTFDEHVRLRKEFGAESTEQDLKDLRFGERTRLFEALESALKQLEKAHYPRRALFLVSDGVNTAGGGNLSNAIRDAQRTKSIVYALVVEKSDTDLNTLRTLAESTGGTYFVLHDEFPRLQAAYDRISTDLANRLTLYYRSGSDYTQVHRPEIRVQMKNPRWHVRYQKAYYAE